MPFKKNRDRIAIVGMAGRFPKARNIGEFWGNLCEGKDAISRAFDDTDKGSNYVNARGILDDVALFDADFFGMNQREANLTDPQHRLFLECCYEALDDAGYAPKYHDGLVGVYGCAGPNRYYYNNIFPHPEYKESLDDPIVRIGNDHDYLTTRVSYKLNFKGPSLTIQTACSSSLASICVACNQLKTGECDIALAGGASVYTPQDEGYYFQSGMIFSPEGVCRPFDANAQGTVPGSGAGVIALKRLEDAIRDKDHIYAVIRGHGINNDGSEKLGFSAPSAKGQTEGIVSAIEMAEVEPETIGYIEAHGTGTVLGDPIEIKALTDAFRRYTDEKEFCGVGSVKSNIGHLMETSGVAGLIKAALSLFHETIPPTIHFNNPNPHIPFENSPFYPVTELKEWKKGKDPRRAFVNALGFGGTNAYLLLEEAPMIPGNHVHHENLFIFSAKTETALQKILLSFQDVPKDGLPLEDIAYTLQVGRTPYSHRAAFIASDLNSLSSQIESFSFKKQSNQIPIEFLLPDIPKDWKAPNLAFYMKDKEFCRDLEMCAYEGETFTGIDFRSHLKWMETQPQKLQEIAHLSITFSMKRWFERLGIVPDSVSGIGLGYFLTLDYSFREILIEALEGTSPPNTANPQALEITPLSREKLLQTLQALWLQGVEIHWPTLYQHNQPRRISLPSYPFERKYYWIDPPLTKKKEVAAVPSKTLSLEETLIAIWKKSLGVDAISAEEDFSDLGGDSLLALQVVAKIKEILGLSLPPNTVLQYPTIEKLCQLIRKEDRKHPFVTLKEGDKTLPSLFMFHQIDGYSISYQELANELDYDGQMIGLESHFSLESPDETLENVAPLYIETIQNIQPKGPYHFVGTSFGGLLSFEVAQQLKKKGEEVHLTMIDIVNPDAYQSREMYETLRDLFSEGTQPPPTSDRTEQIKQIMKQMQFDSISFSQQEKIFDLMNIHWNAFRNYHPKPYDGEVLFFEGTKRIQALKETPLHSTWKHLIKKMDTSMVEGTHLGVMKQPCVKQVCTKIHEYQDTKYAKV